MHRKGEHRLFYKDLLSPLAVGTEKEGLPQQVVCYRAGHEAGGLDLKEKRER